MRKRFFWATMFLAGLLLLAFPALAASQGDTIELELTVTSKDAYYVQVEYTIDENIFEFVEAKPALGVMSNKSFVSVRVDKAISGAVGSLKLRIRDSAPNGEYTIQPVVKAAWKLDESPTTATAEFSFVIVGKEQAKEVVLPEGRFLLDPNGSATFLAPANQKASKLTIPEKVSITRKLETKKAKKLNYTVTAIGDSACKGMSSLTGVSFSKKIKSIGANAFSGCKKLKTVSGGAGVTKIGDGAFQNCAALTEFTIFANVSSIGANAFNGCKKLATITLKPKPQNLTEKKIGANAFKGIAKKVKIICDSRKIADSYKAFMTKKGVPKTATWTTK